MRIAFIPGFSQPALAWDRVIAALPAPASTDADAVDVPHGSDFVATAATIGRLAGTAVYVRYSMGGRLALRLALDRPDLVRALVLVSAAPGIDDPVARQDRSTLDRDRAEEIRTLGVPAFLDAWLAQPLFNTLPRDAAMLEARMASMDAIRLAHQMVELGQGEMEPLGHRLHELQMPTTVIVGRADTRYSEIGRGMVDRISDAHLIEIDGGHALPLEQPGPVAAAIAAVHAATK